MWLQFEVDLGPFGPRAGPESSPNDPDRTTWLAATSIDGRGVGPNAQETVAVGVGALAGSLAVHWQLGILIYVVFGQFFGQTWPQNPSRTTGRVLQCRLHQKSAPQTNSKTISWQFGIRKSPPPMNR